MNIRVVLLSDWCKSAQLINKLEFESPEWIKYLFFNVSMWEKVSIELHLHTHTHTLTSPAPCQVSRHCSTNKMETWHSWSILITEIITHWSLGMLLILRAVVCITVISDLNNLKGLFSPLKFKVLSHVWMSLQGLINVYWCIEQRLKWLSCVWLCFPHRFGLGQI